MVIRQFCEMFSVKVLLVGVVVLFVCGVGLPGEVVARVEMQNGHEGDPTDGNEMVSGGGGDPEDGLDSLNKGEFSLNQESFADVLDLEWFFYPEGQIYIRFFTPVREDDSRIRQRSLTYSIW